MDPSYLQLEQKPPPPPPHCIEAIYNKETCIMSEKVSVQICFFVKKKIIVGSVPNASGTYWNLEMLGFDPWSPLGVLSCSLNPDPIHLLPCL